MSNPFLERPILNSPYDYPTPIINELRQRVDQWRQWPNPNEWLITPKSIANNSEIYLIWERFQDVLESIRGQLNKALHQKAHKEDKISFSSIAPWPGTLVCAEGRYLEEDAGKERRAAIFVGPEFGTVSRPDLVEAAREAGDSGFDVLIACAFNYDARSTEFNKLGRIPVLKARMNADLHMADDLKNTGKGNLFVIFGEPDISIVPAGGNQIQVKVNGVNDPYKALKTTLKAEVNEEARATLHSDTSRPFPKPADGRIAVKVINHLGDEVMKVFRVRE